MSNKTSDNNVANIEEDVRRLTEISKCVTYSMWGEDTKALRCILAEREQKDKRIKELEEELENSIPKQAVIDKINELKLSGGSDGKDNVENLVRELTIDVLQELLEGEK